MAERDNFYHISPCLLNSNRFAHRCIPEDCCFPQNCCGQPKFRVHQKGVERKLELPLTV